MKYERPVYLRVEDGTCYVNEPEGTYKSEWVENLELTEKDGRWLITGDRITSMFCEDDLFSLAEVRLFRKPDNFELAPSSLFEQVIAQYFWRKTPKELYRLKPDKSYWQWLAHTSKVSVDIDKSRVIIWDRPSHSSD